MSDRSINNPTLSEWIFSAGISMEENREKLLILKKRENDICWWIFRAWFLGCLLLTWSVLWSDDRHHQLHLIVNFTEHYYSSQPGLVWSVQFWPPTTSKFTLLLSSQALPCYPRLRVLDKSGKYFVIKIFIWKFMIIRLLPARSSDIYSSNSFRELDRAFCLFLNVL